MKTCSVLIPTRKRPNRLQRAIDSVFATAGPQKHEFEVLLRMDEDDLETQSLMEHFRYRYGPNVKHFVGSRLAGYHSLFEFYTELSEKAEGTFLFLLNDDITIEGNGWLEQLQKLPACLHIAPEWYQLGGSGYGNGGGGYPPCPIIPNGCWRPVIGRYMPSPVDVGFVLVLVEQLGWRRHILPGIKVNHQRDREDVLAVHRKM